MRKYYMIFGMAVLVLIAIFLFYGNERKIKESGGNVIRKEESIDIGTIDEKESENNSENIEVAADTLIYPETISVLLETSGYGGFYHEEVVVTCLGKFQIGNDHYVQLYDGGDQVLISKALLAYVGGSLKIQPLENEMLSFPSIARSGGIHPTYPGEVTLTLVDAGIVVVNTCPFEEYLKRVVPCEMPARYGLETAKIQAICARSYALTQMVNGTNILCNAQVYDSSLSQVYNNFGEMEVSSEGVEATKGQILTYEGNVFAPYYFSTSCGYTADATIWGDTVEHKPYLTAHPVSEEEKLELWDEAVFSSFIENWDYPAWESEYTWFRWKTELFKTGLGNLMEQRLIQLIGENEGNILTIGLDGTESSAISSTLGTIQKMEVTNRKNGGNVLEVTIYGEAQTVKVQGEMAVRKLLRNPENNYQNKSFEGSGTSEGEYLPSSFFCFVEKEDQYEVWGGGNGHGLGMTQNGAYEMVLNGRSSKDVLSFFYPGTMIYQIQQ